MKVRSLVQQIESLRRWLYKQDYDLIMGAHHWIEDSVCLEDKLVFINTRSSLQNQVYSLLHECGHIILCKNEKKYYKKFPGIKIAEKKDGRKAQTNEYLVNVVDEEMQAWKEGLALARRKGFAISEKKYNKYAADCVMFYIKKIGRYGYRGYIKTTKEILEEERKKKDIDIPQPL